MRFPIFSRRSNPSIDPPILRKSRCYVEEQVAAGRADWVDPTEPWKGIICRELLHLGTREPEAEAPSLGNSPRELPGLKWIPPASDQRPTLGALAAGWDWAYEAWPQAMEPIAG